MRLNMAICLTGLIPLRDIGDEMNGFIPCETEALFCAYERAYITVAVADLVKLPAQFCTYSDSLDDSLLLNSFHRASPKK